MPAVCVLLLIGVPGNIGKFTSDGIFPSGTFTHEKQMLLGAAYSPLAADTPRELQPYVIYTPLYYAPNVPMGFLDDKQNHLTWTPLGGDVSGDLGYTYGTFEFRSKDKDGKAVIEHGKYTSIWKKQKDGRWKVVLDMGNSDGAH